MASKQVLPMTGPRFTLLTLALALSLILPSPGAGGEIAGPANPRMLQIEREFALFAADWIEKIARNYAHRADNIQVIPKEMHFLGRYAALDRDSVSWSVKQASNSPQTYIGLLEYTEWTYECTAPTREEILQQCPFAPVKGRKVTEIFRYGKNRWLE